MTSCFCKVSLATSQGDECSWSGEMIGELVPSGTGSVLHEEGKTRPVTLLVGVRELVALLPTHLAESLCSCWRSPGSSPFGVKRLDG